MASPPNQADLDRIIRALVALGYEVRPPQRRQAGFEEDDRPWEEFVDAIRTAQEGEGSPGGQVMSDSEVLMDAKIATAEARTDTKIARVEGKLDVVISKLDGLREDNRALRDDNRATRANQWVIGFGLALLIIAVAALFPVFLT